METTWLDIDYQGPCFNITSILDNILVLMLNLTKFSGSKPWIFNILAHFGSIWLKLGSQNIRYTIQWLLRINKRKKISNKSEEGEDLVSYHIITAQLYILCVESSDCRIWWILSVMLWHDSHTQTLYDRHYVWQTLSMTDTVYDRHCVWQTLCVTDTVYDRHCLWQTLSMTHTEYDTHSVGQTLRWRGPG